MNWNRNGTTCVKKTRHLAQVDTGEESLGLLRVLRLCEGQKPFSRSGAFPQTSSHPPFKLPSPTFTIGFHKGNDVPLACTSIWRDCWFVLTVRMVVSPSLLSMRPRGAKRGLFTNTVRHMAQKHTTTWILRAHTHTHFSHLPVWCKKKKMPAHMSRKTHTEGEELCVVLHSTMTSM